MFSQPTGTQPETAIGMPLLAHDQLQHAITGNRGNRILPCCQGNQRIDQGLGMQANQVLTTFG
ncbi:hypothetical protein D3C75_1288210 [compost metagenome]